MALFPLIIVNNNSSFYIALTWAYIPQGNVIRTALWLSTIAVGQRKVHGQSNKQQNCTVVSHTDIPMSFIVMWIMRTHPNIYLKFPEKWNLRKPWQQVGRRRQLWFVVVVNRVNSNLISAMLGQNFLYCDHHHTECRNVYEVVIITRTASPSHLFLP